MKMGIMFHLVCLLPGHHVVYFVCNLFSKYVTNFFVSTVKRERFNSLIRWNFHPIGINFLRSRDRFARLIPFSTAKYRNFISDWELPLING
jgi:hypothetical protein